MSKHHPHHDRHVLLLSLFRMVLAFLSLSFFLYFFLTEVGQIGTSKKDVDSYKYHEVPYRVFVDALVEEQSLLVHHLTAQEYRYRHSINITLSMTPTIRQAVQGSPSAKKSDVLTQLAALNQMRQKVFNGSIEVLEVIDFYEGLIGDVITVWVYHCSGAIEAINNNVMQDVYHDLINQDISMQRDLLLALLLYNNTPAEYLTLKKHAIRYINLNPILINNAFLYGTEALGQYYNNLFSLPSIIEALTIFNQMVSLTSLNYQQNQQYRANNYSLPGYPHFDVVQLEGSFYTLLDALDLIDTVEGDPDFPDLLVRSVMAILGLVLQVVITGSLIWVVAVSIVISIRKKAKSPSRIVSPPSSEASYRPRNVM